MDTITIVIESRKGILTAYHVGLNTSDGSDFRSFVARGTDRAALVAEAARIYPSATVVVFPGTFSQWLRSVR